MEHSIRIPLAILLVAFTAQTYAKQGVLSGKGTESDPYLIEDYEDLKAINKTDLGGTYRLANDIDASPSSTEDSGKGFIPIGGTQPNAGSWTNESGFRGSIHGGGHTIRNLRIWRWETFVGLVGFTRIDDSLPGLLDSIHLIDADIRGYSLVGGIAGISDKCPTITSDKNPSGVRASRIRNCSFSGYIQGAKVTGGISGCGDVEFSTTSGRIESVFDGYGIGGVVGLGTATSSSSTIFVRGKQEVGGIVGRGSVYSSHFAGSVEGEESVGGLVGEGGIVDQSYSSGTIKNGFALAGGISWGYGSAGIGNSFSDAILIGLPCGRGGLVGQMMLGEIVNSYANLTQKSCNDSIDGCASRRGCKKTNSPGLVDLIVGESIIKSSYWAMSPDINPSAGYWTEERFSDNPAEAIETRPNYSSSKGLTSEQMKQSAQFAGWDFSSAGPWTIDEGLGFPRLRILKDIPYPVKTAPTRMTTAPFSIQRSRQGLIIKYADHDVQPVVASVARVDGSVVASLEHHPANGTNAFVLPLPSGHRNQLLVVTLKRGGRIVGASTAF